MMPSFINTVRTGWALAARSIRIQIREHLLGYSWNLIIPILYAISFIFVKQGLMGDQNITDSEHSWSVLRAFAGITLFQLWMQVLQEVSEFIRRNRGMLRGLDIGVAPFILGIVFEGGVSLMIRVITVLIALPVLGLAFPDNVSAWLWIGFALAGLFMSAVSIGLLLAPWSVIYGDVRKAIQSLSLPLVLISPIFYPAVTSPDLPLYWVNIMNPIASPLGVISDAFRGNPQTYDVALIAWFGISLLLLVWMATQIHRQVPILLERMGN